MNRRTFLAGGGLALSAVLAGCSSDETSNENENEAYAEQAANAVDEEPDVRVDNWTINDGTFHLHFTPLGTNERAVQLVAGAYAGNVDNGLDLPLTGYGYELESDETTLYFQIEVDWAQQFMEDELTESEYLSRIEETMA